MNIEVNTIISEFGPKNQYNYAESGSKLFNDDVEYDVSGSLILKSYDCNGDAISDVFLQVDRQPLYLPEKNNFSYSFANFNDPSQPLWVTHDLSFFMSMDQSGVQCAYLIPMAVLKKNQPNPKDLNRYLDNINKSNVFSDVRLIIPVNSGLDGYWLDMPLTTDMSKFEVSKVLANAHVSKKQVETKFHDPYKCLGYGEDKYYFYSRERKQIITRTAASLNESALLELAPSEHWKYLFSMDGDTKKIPKTEIVDHLIRVCHSKGLFSPERYTRGRGAWVDQNRLVYHFGDHLNVDGLRQGVETFDSKFVYECNTALNAPDGIALSDFDGKRLLDIASMFRWKQSSSALLAIGYIALAPLCGVLKWRPHIWITGGAGSGKSTILNSFVNPLIGSNAIFAQGNSTEAGIRQTLKSDALPVVFDEGESNNTKEAERMQSVLSLIRQSSSDSAAKTLKGTAGGKSMSFYIRSMFCLASIQASIHHQADLERITKLELKNKGGENSGDEWDKLRDTLYGVIERDETLPMRLFQRSINLFDITKKNIEVFCKVAANKFDSQRKGDQYGTLLAGCWSMINSGLASEEQAEKLINQYDWTEYQEGTEVEESEKALTYFFGCKLKTDSHKEYTIHELLTEFNHIPDDESKQFLHEQSAVKTLKRHDMIHDKEAGILYISNNSSHVNNLFKGTVYEAGWRDQMLRAKGVYKEAKKQKKFGGRNSRYFYLLLSEIE